MAVPPGQIEAFYIQYIHRLRKYLQQKVDKQTAEDIAQVTFVKALENLHAFRGHASPFTWLWSIANNTLKNEYRSRTRKSETYIDSDCLYSHFVSYEFTENVEIRLDIGSSLKQLNEIDCEIITLHYDVGCTLKEISEIVGLSLSATKNRLYRALIKLRVHLADHEGVPAVMQLIQKFMYTHQPTHQQAKQIQEDLLGQLRSQVGHIAELIRHEPTDKMTIEIYPDLNTFHLAVNEPEAPDWFMGVIEGKVIKIVSPLNPGPAHTYQSILQSTVHLFTIVMVKEVNPSAPKWLYQGLGGYEAGLMSKEYVRSTIREEVHSGYIPTFSDLEDNSWGFEHQRGFQFAFTLADFTLSEYGKEGLNRLIRNSADFTKALCCTEAEFRRRWVSFLEENYS